MARSKQDTAVAKQQFLEAFAETGRVDMATKRAAIAYDQPNRWAAVDPEFAKAYAETREIAAGHIEDAAYRRAVHGVQRPIYQKGVLVGFERVYSDNLAMFLLRGLKPKVYRERVAISGDADAPPVQHDVKVGLSDEAAEQIRAKILGLGGGK